MNALVIALFVVGYPVSIAVIARFVPVVRQRRLRWFVAHQFAVAAIVIGWALKTQWRSVVVNATWLVVAWVWYWRAGRQRNAESTSSIDA